MRRAFTLLFLLWIACGIVQAQDQSKMNLGIGIGLNYGSLGTRFTYRPIPHIGLSASLGYNSISLSPGLGAQWRITPNTSVVPTLGFMYGNNGTINADYLGSSNQLLNYQKIEYGPSLMGGFELHVPHNFLFIGATYAFHSKEFKDAYNTYKTFSNLGDLKPFGFTFGFHFVF